VTGPRTSADGFSLIEVLVVVAITGILLSIVWVRMSTLVPIYRLEGAARSLAAEIQNARVRAISENKCFQVVIDTTNKTYQLQRDQRATTANSASCSGVTFVNDPAYGARAIDDATSLTVAFSQGSNPIFTPRGHVDVTPAPTLTLTNVSGAVRTIFVQANGRINVQ